MTTYLIHAWCIRPFISFLDEVEAETPKEAIAFARRHPEKLLDAAEECDSQYRWDEFAVFGPDGTELLRVLDAEARLRQAVPVMQDTLHFVAQVLADFKPDVLRQLGLNPALEKVEKTMAILCESYCE